MAVFDEIRKQKILEYANVRYVEVTISAGTTLNVSHGLKRTPRKWTVAKISADANIWGTDDQEQLHLNASADCTATLEVN